MTDLWRALTELSEIAGIGMAVLAALFIGACAAVHVRLLVAQMDLANSKQRLREVQEFVRRRAHGTLRLDRKIVAPGIYEWTIAPDADPLMVEYVSQIFGRPSEGEFITETHTNTLTELP